MVHINDVNIGLVIEQKINEKNISKSEFGRMIGIPQQNVNRILNKPNIDTDKLAKISEALEYNFFQEFVTKDNDSAETVYKRELTEIDNKQQPLTDSDKKFYQDQIQFLTEQVKDLSKRNHELEDELRNIHREKKQM